VEDIREEVPRNPVNLKTLRRLIPPWAFNQRAQAVAINDRLTEVKRSGNGLPEGWWIDCNVVDGGMYTMIMHPDAAPTLAGLLRIMCPSPLGCRTEITVPALSLFLPTYQKYTYSVYSHGFGRELNGVYIGLTKRPWFERFNEHIGSARRGSKLLFHQMIASHPQNLFVHRVLGYGLDYETAMNFEEANISKNSLYPNGLNMIPGGFAGMKYLSRVGVTARNEVERDAAIEELVCRKTIDGKPNPLCASRWASDQEFVNRIIRGHGNRLSVEQVRDARVMLSYGNESEDVALSIGAKPRQIRDLDRGRHYGRVV